MVTTLRMPDLFKLHAHGILFLLLLLTGCVNNHPSNDGQTEFSDLSYVNSTNISGDGPMLKFKEQRYNFGTIKRMHTPELAIDFAFENTGNTPLVIYKIDVSCGCLIPQFSRQPVMPGGTGSVKIIVDVKTQGGDFNKTIFIKSNACNDVELLRITGFVK